MCCRGWWVGKPPSMMALPFPRMVGHARPVSSNTWYGYWLTPNTKLSSTIDLFQFSDASCLVNQESVSSPPWHLSAEVQPCQPAPFPQPVQPRLHPWLSKHTSLHFLSRPFPRLIFKTLPAGQGSSLRSCPPPPGRNCSFPSPEYQRFLVAHVWLDALELVKNQQHLNSAS